MAGEPAQVDGSGPSGFSGPIFRAHLNGAHLEQTWLYGAEAEDAYLSGATSKAPTPLAPTARLRRACSRRHVHEEPERFFVPPYVGRRGWLEVRLDVGVDWEEVAGILTDAPSGASPPSPGGPNVFLASYLRAKDEYLASTGREVLVPDVAADRRAAGGHPLDELPPLGPGAWRCSVRGPSAVAYDPATDAWVTFDAGRGNNPPRALVG